VEVVAGTVGSGVSGSEVWAGDGRRVGVSGKIRLVAARQAKVDARSISVDRMSV